MEFMELLPRFAVALGIGLLIGLERGWRSRQDAPGSRTAGIRTFAITGLLGGAVGAIALALGGSAGAAGGIVLGLSFAAFAVAITIFCRDENLAEENFSATTAIAAMATFALGAYALVGDFRLAAAAAVAIAVILALRDDLHGLLRQMTWPELRSALVLLAMTCIALPVMPDRSIGPFGGVNPREVWMIAVVLATVSFAGYVAVKFFGARHGEMLAAAAGGLVSSTAVTAANAKRAAAGEGVPRLLAAGVSIATAISLVRVLAVAAALNWALVPLLAPPLIAAAIVAVGFALVSAYWRNEKKTRRQVMHFNNPFSFWSVVGFALLLGVMILLGQALNEWLGAAGVIVGALAMGLADVDAVTVSMARLAPQPLSYQAITLAILAAVLSNTLSKLVIGAVVGRGAFALELAAMSAACLIAAGLGLWLGWTLTSA